MLKKNDVKKRALFYLNSIARKVPIKQAVLFGSYVHEKANNDSDIDLAIFSPKFSNKTHLEDVKFLWTEAARIDPFIEPLPFPSSEISGADPRSFLGEILKTGKIIFKR